MGMLEQYLICSFFKKLLVSHLADASQWMQCFICVSVVRHHLPPSSACQKYYCHISFLPVHEFCSPCMSFPTVMKVRSTTLASSMQYVPRSPSIRYQPGSSEVYDPSESSTILTDWSVVNCQDGDGDESIGSNRSPSNEDPH